MSGAYLDFDALQAMYPESSVGCDLCGSESSETVTSIGKIGSVGEYGALRIDVCLSCGQRYLKNRRPDQYYVDYYRTIYREVAFGDLIPSDRYVSEQLVRGKNVRTWFEAALEESGVQSSIEGSRKPSMLDHGCASGATMIDWIDNDYDCRGVDPNEPSVVASNSHAWPVAGKVDVGFGEDLPYDDGQFDVVMSLGSLEHVYSFDRTIKEIDRVLNPRGFVVIRYRSPFIYGSPLEYFNHNHFRYFDLGVHMWWCNKYGYTTIAFSSRPIEGWDNYNYIIVQKTTDLDSIRSRPLSDGFVDPSSVREYVQKRYDHFRKRASQILTMEELITGVETVDEALSVINAQPQVFLPINGGDPAINLKRLLFEARKFFEFDGQI